MVVNDYDLRHTFGRDAKKVTDELYLSLRDGYDKFVKILESKKSKILSFGPEVEWYHAGIGVKENCIILIHNTGSLMDLALKFKEHGVENAVLLDSGGSPVIWANWTKGGVLAHNFNYRSKRGAVIIVEIS
jgi:hypothetical protein